jgi:hypothetical protein
MIPRMLHAMVTSDPHYYYNNYYFIIVIIIDKQIEELYSEVLYEILHIVGCDASVEEERTPLFCYLQEAFKLDLEKHNHLLEIARAKEVNVTF